MTTDYPIILLLHCRPFDRPASASARISPSDLAHNSPPSELSNYLSVVYRAVQWHSAKRAEVHF